MFLIADVMVLGVAVWAEVLPESLQLLLCSPNKSQCQYTRLCSHTSVRDMALLH